MATDSRGVQHDSNRGCRCSRFGLCGLPDRDKPVQGIWGIGADCLSSGSFLGNTVLSAYVIDGSSDPTFRRYTLNQISAG